MSWQVLQATPRQSRLIGRILAPALQLWLRSQVDQAEGLQCQIEGSDRQLLSGFIHRVTIAAERAVYRDLCLRQVQVVGTDIRTNFSQIFRGKPLQLLEVVPVQVRLELQAADLNASKQVPILRQALSELLLQLIRASSDEFPAVVQPDQGDRDGESPQTWQLQQFRVEFAQRCLLLWLHCLTPAHRPITVSLKTGLQPEKGNVLKFTELQWQMHSPVGHSVSLPPLPDFQLSLGTDVNIEAIDLQPGKVTCQGCLQVVPTELAD